MNLLDTYQCPGCGDDHTESARCDHADLHCPDCNDEGFCHLCSRERAEDIADDIATERALDAWRGVA